MTYYVSSGTLNSTHSHTLRRYQTGGFSVSVKRVSLFLSSILCIRPDLFVCLRTELLKKSYL